MNRSRQRWSLFLAVWCAWVARDGGIAAPVLGPWQPLFKGIDHRLATNFNRSPDFDILMVANALRIDLQDPDIRLFSTPRIANYEANVRETAGRTVSRFLQVNHLQVAINANFFDPSEYYLPEGTAMAVKGLAISDGLQVSSATGSVPVLIADALNHAQIVPTNRPMISLAGVHTAISGDYPLVVNGANIGRQYLAHSGIVHDRNPRTAIGLSQDKRYLYLLAIDGRQPGYSEGAYDYETGAWLKLLGAYAGFNLDGGGSTTMVMQNSTGSPKRLNRSSAVADSGRERTVGSHFGVFALPLPGFINQVIAQPDDEAAVVTWTTLASATAQVEYGLTSDFGLSSTLQPIAATNHTVLLTGLKPDTGYYFRALSTVGATRFASSNLFFTTTNYVSTNLLIDTTGLWKSTISNLDQSSWTTTNYDDTAWSGPAAGLLWVDVRSTGPNPQVQPKGELLPVDPSNDGLPYLTYYFRTRFLLARKAPRISLRFSAYVDDGAVFYLNGSEIYRLRMDDVPTPIVNGSPATGIPCEGDATCTDDFAIEGALADQLVEGENLIAVEVHNYNLRSPDITFGLNLTVAVPVGADPQLSITDLGDSISLSWNRNAFLLQQAEVPSGPWSDVPGPIVTSPFRTSGKNATRYYRLIR